MESAINREIAVGDRRGTVLGTGLGIFSLGLGAAELFAPGGVARLIGVRDRGAVGSVVRAFGAREVATGIGLLARPSSKLGPWARVVGDLLDLAALGWALRRSVARGRTIGALAAVAGVAAIDTYAGIRRSRRTLGKPMRRTITINREPHEVYALWRNLERVHEFMRWVDDVHEAGGNLSHWTISTPAGGKLELDAELTEDVPNQRIAWRTLPRSPLQMRGSVTFKVAPGNRGTEVTIEQQVNAPFAKTIASEQAMGDLRRLKQLLETGEVLESDASIHALPHPAQPSRKGGMP